MLLSPQCWAWTSPTTLSSMLSGQSSPTESQLESTKRGLVTRVDSSCRGRSSTRDGTQRWVATCGSAGRRRCLAVRKHLFATPFLTKNRTFVNPGSKKARQRLDTGTSSAGVQAAFVVNRSDKPITVTVPLAALGVKDGVKVYDIWVRKRRHHFVFETEYLPRQARDKHRQS